LRDRGVAGVFAAILPAPEMDDLRRVVGQLGDLFDQLLALLEGRGRFGMARLVTANAINESIVVEMIRNCRHAAADKLGAIEPGEGSAIVGSRDEIKTADRLLLDEQVGRLLVAAVARSARP